MVQQRFCNFEKLAGKNLEKNLSSFANDIMITVIKCISEVMEKRKLHVIYDELLLKTFTTFKAVLTFHNRKQRTAILSLCSCETSDAVLKK